MKTMWRVTRRSRKAQSLIEFALGGILLVMLLAGAVDIGRIFYTYIVVQNMANEGATYLAFSPDNDYTISQLDLRDTFQGRAQLVAARVMGMVISPTNVRVTSDNNTSDVAWDVPQSQRCMGTSFSVHVNYRMNDLFFPGLLGFSSINIGATEQAAFFADSYVAQPNCPTPTLIQ